MPVDDSWNKVNVTFEFELPWDNISDVKTCFYLIATSGTDAELPYSAEIVNLYRSLYYSWRDSYLARRLAEQDGMDSLLQLRQIFQALVMDTDKEIAAERQRLELLREQRSLENA